MRGKKKIGLFLSLLVGLVCMTATAFAADNVPGIYDVQKSASVTEARFQTADGRTVQPTELTVGGQAHDDFYAQAEKITLTYNGAKNGDFHLILALSGDSRIPTADNMVYIDQKTADNSGTVTFTVFPSQMKSGTYHIYQSNSSGNGLKDVLSFTYYQSYMLGDVDSNGVINSDDALRILQYRSGKITLTASELAAANVTIGDDIVNSDDALRILQFRAGQIDHLG